MKKTKNEVIKIRIVPIILLMLIAIIFYTLAFTDTMEQIGVRINSNNTIREVQAGDVAKILRDGKEYGFSTLEDAIETAENGETIVLLKNVDSGNTITINKNITISGSEYAIYTKGITNTADLTIEDVTIQDNETEETIAVNNTGKLYLKSVVIENINGTGIKNTGTLGFKNNQTNTIKAKKAIDGKVDEVPQKYGVNITNVNANQQTATIISETDAANNNYEMISGNIFYKVSDILDTTTDEEYTLINSDIFYDNTCEIKIIGIVNLNTSFYTDKSIKIEEGKKLLLDLNGVKDIRVNKFYNCGTLELKNGSLKSISTATIENHGGILQVSDLQLNHPSWSSDGEIHEYKGTVNIGGTSVLKIRNEKDGEDAGICNISGDFKGEIYNSGTTNIKEGNIDAYIVNYSIMNIGSEEDSDNDNLNIKPYSENFGSTDYRSCFFNNGGILNIYSGNIYSGESAKNERAIYNSSSSSINMKGGHITAQKNGIYIGNDSSGVEIKIEKGIIETTDTTGDDSAIYARSNYETNIYIGDGNNKVERDKVIIKGNNRGIYENSNTKIMFGDGKITANYPVVYKDSININIDGDNKNYYELKEIDEEGSKKSLFLSDKEPPEITVSVDKSKTSDRSITLNIKATDFGDGVDKFKIYYRDKSSSTTLETGDIAWKESENDINVYELSGLDANTTYVMKVVVFDKNGNEKESTEVETVTNATPTAVTGVSLNKSETTIEKGETETLEATITPGNAANKNVEWTSSDSEVAKVDSNGVVTGVKKGTAIITVTTEDGRHTATCNVTVKEEPATISVTEVSLNKNETTIEVGKTDTLTATVSPEDATNKNVTWESSDTTVATVDDSGLVLGVKEGTAIITVTTEDGKKTATCQVTIVEKSIKSISIKSEPTKKTYVKGQELDLTGGMITITYDDDTTKDVEITKDMITGYIANVLGEQEITVTYKGKTTTFKVTVTNNITSLTIKALPTTKKYLKGQKLDLTGGKIKVEYENNEDNEEVEMKSTDVTVTGYDLNKIGEQTVTITYKGKSTTFNVTVVEKNEVSEITIISVPKKTIYIKGENLNIAGGKIKAKYLDKTTADVNMTEDMITEYDKNTLGKQTVKVTYGEATTTFDVTVKNGVSKIVIDSKPTTLIYVKGKVDELDLTGGKISVTYDDNSTETIDIESSMIDGYNKNNVGKQTITVKYGDKTDEFEITVKNDITDIVISNVPDKLIYEKGKSLDLTGGKVKIIYENGENEELEMKASDISVTGYDANKLGEQTITVKYGDKTATFKVTVKAESSNNDDDSSNNNSSNSDNSNSNSNKNQQSATKKDNTTANIILPKTGIGKILLGIIVLLTVGGVTYIRFRKLKDVK